MTLYVFYPGIMTFDALYIYKDMAKGTFGDWQSPAMLALWSLVDPIAPGSGSILLLTVALYWLAFALAALAIARRSPRLAVLVPVLALAPPAFVLVGVIWRDILFASPGCSRPPRFSPRPNATGKCASPFRSSGLVFSRSASCCGRMRLPPRRFSRPISYGPQHFRWKRTALLYVPAALGLFGLVQVVYYGVFGAQRQHPLHSIMVFDLGGISHFAKENVFPGAWTEKETTLITDGCYQPIAWDIYWTQQPCLFVMQRLEGEKLFGTPALADAWRQAIIGHPFAYLQHRVTFYWTFLAGPSLAMWTRDLDDADKIIFADKPRLMAVKAVNDTLQATPLFRAGAWLLLNVGSVPVRLAAAQYAGGWLRPRHLRIGRSVFADFFCRRRIHGFTIQLLGDTRWPHWRDGCRAAADHKR